MSPVRVNTVITFDGDTSKLPLDERIFADQFRLFTRQEFPYAILMYIWENRAPVGRVIDNLHTTRIKTTSSGAEHLGTWRSETRNVYEDFKRAFGEDPPRIRLDGIMTDSDNTWGTDGPRRTTATSRSCGRACRWSADRRGAAGGAFPEAGQPRS